MSLFMTSLTLIQQISGKSGVSRNSNSKKEALNRTIYQVHEKSIVHNF